MTEEELKNCITNLNIWKKKDERAPHKPLLLLYALAQLQNSGKRLMSFEEVKGPLTRLLQDFGPHRKSYHPEEPFTRLVRDGIWETPQLQPGVSVSGSWLVNHHISGGFSEEVAQLLKENPRLVQEIVELLLYTHFPETLHDDILTAVGLDVAVGPGSAAGELKRRARSPEFREKVLRAYEYSCAVCNLYIRLKNQLVAIEAAHIKWFNQGGPDVEENGLALCSLHHKLLDLGAYTLNSNRQLIVAETANGSGLDEWLMRFHGKEIRKPINPKYFPDTSFLSWHEKEVFKSPGRYV